MILNDAGRMVRDVWQAMPDHYPGVCVDEMVVMPNHVHGIVVIADAPAAEAMRAGTGGPAPTEHMSLIDAMKRFKSLTTVRYGIGVRQHGWARYSGSLWQRSYYERGIRNDRELDATRVYILRNPEQWQFDRENPKGRG
jgi:REP element-mobilizing transposase RayT